MTSFRFKKTVHNTRYSFWNKLALLTGLTLLPLPFLHLGEAHADLSPPKQAPSLPQEISKDALISKGPYLFQTTPHSTELRFERAPGFMAPNINVILENGSKENQTVAPFECADRVCSASFSGLQASHRYVYELRGFLGTTHPAGATIPRMAPFRGSFLTAPEGDEAFTFLLYGDSRSDHKAHERIVKQMLEVPADFLINTGDLVAEGSNPDDWETFFKVETPLLSKTCMFPAIGNHELYDSGGLEFFRFFGPKQEWKNLNTKDYKPNFNTTMRWGNTRFFFLNGFDSWKEGKSRTWLESELSKAEAEPGLKYRIAVLHHGLFSSGPHGDNKAMLEAGIPELFRKSHINLVLSGHDHIYERGEFEGLKYIVSGGAGAPSYPIESRHQGSRKSESARHFVKVSVTPEKMVFTTQKLNGSVLETCGFLGSSSSASWDCDAKAEVANVQAQAPSPPPSKPQSKSSCLCKITPEKSVTPWYFSIFLMFMAWKRRA